MNTQRNHRARGRGRRIAVVSLLAATSLVACGSDPPGATDSTAAPDTTTPPETTEAAATTEAPTVTEPPVTTPSPGVVRGISDANTFVDPTDPTCTYRNREIISAAAAADIQTEIGGSVTDLGRVTPEDSDIAAELHLFDIDVEPLFAATQLANQGIQASPNYIYAFAPGWQYAPYDDPTNAEPIQAGPLSTASAEVAVLDTGWTATGRGTPASAPPTSTPGFGATPVTEVLDGRAAGHGTFIVNLLGQLLPNATFVASGIESRSPTDDNFLLSDQSVVSIRDDYSVTRALVQLVGSGVPYLNLSFGSYGCTARHQGAAELEEMEPFYMPLGLGTALAQLGERGSMEAFAASGNDGRDGSTAEMFFPAGWAPLYGWLHSVASDPKDGDDYSNRGTWVETQARGSNTVSLLPPTTSWGQTEHWAAWSGTSFATPCALAMSVANQFVEYPAFPSVGEFMDCGLNLPPGP